MIFATPGLSREDLAVLELIERQREQLRHHVNTNPRRWTGFLRRNAFARAIQGSNSIEGYDATYDDAVAAVDGDEPSAADRETWLAVTGYRDAMTYILQIARDPHFKYDPQLIRSLHYMMIKYDLSKHPGQWRPGYVRVVDQRTGKTAYEGPDAQQVPELVDELVDFLRDRDDTPDIVKAAMAHLNLTLIHPFSDGNGRMARALQTLVLVREGMLGETFSSIEEWLGRNTRAYYDVLAEVGRGRWQPQRDAAPWMRFCLRAHYQQAATLIRRNNEMGRVWEQIAGIVEQHDLPDRCEAALVDAAYGFRVTNARYRHSAEVSEHQAGRDLKRLADLGLLIAVGEKRGRYYVGSDDLKRLRASLRDPRRADDPYDVILRDMAPELPLA
ncbi:MAG: Fic family protein [Alphaproteobacteria bacterium]